MCSCVFPSVSDYFRPSESVSFTNTPVFNVRGGVEVKGSRGGVVRVWVCLGVCESYIQGNSSIYLSDSSCGSAGRGPRVRGREGMKAVNTALEEPGPASVSMCFLGPRIVNVLKLCSDSAPYSSL